MYGGEQSVLRRRYSFIAYFKYVAISELNVNFGPVMWKWTSEMRRVTIHKSRVAKRSAFMYIVTSLISDVHFHITVPKLTFKTYNYRHCDTSMSPKNADYFPSGGVIATLLGNCKVLCYANMNVTLFRVSANQISVFSITQQSR